MKNLYYPAIFHQAEEGGFWVTFPDFPECMTQGEDIQNVYEMAADALGLAITSRDENGEAIPSPTEPGKLIIEENCFCAVIEFNMNAYQKRISSKSVKKTLSIPEWLNEKSIEAGVNFSQVLQEALMQKLGMK